MAVPNWQELAKSPLDPQTIEEAIQAAIDVHNQDPDAHMGSEQAIQNHRTAEVADHPAQSVVNDKIFPAARAYVAIVGSGADGDFATLDEAIDYAASVGGGDVLIMPGTYAPQDLIVLPQTVNLVGIDRDSCIITGGYGQGGYFMPVDDGGSVNSRQYFRNLTFNVTGDAMFFTEQFGVAPQCQYVFEDCRIVAPSQFIYCDRLSFQARYCTLQLSAEGAIVLEGYCELMNCKVSSRTTNNSFAIFGCWGEFSTDPEIWIYNSQIWTTGTGYCQVASGTSYKHINSFNSYYFNYDNSTGDDKFNLLIGNYFFAGTDGILPRNAGPNVGYWRANVTYDGLRNTGGEYYDSGSGAGALPLNIFDNVQRTCTGNHTFTAPAGRYGKRCTLFLINSAATARTITFGTGFRNVPTLSMAATANIMYVLEFVSGPGGWCQISRSAGM